MSAPFILLDDARADGASPARLYANPREAVVARTVDEVLPELKRIDALRGEGLHLAGYLAYEAGLALEPRLCGLMPDGCRGPLVALGIYSGPVAADGLLARAAEEADRVRLPAFHGLTPRADYDRAM